MKIKKKEIIFILLIAFFILNLFTIKVFAEGELTIDKESLDVKLNGKGYLYTSGGTGTTTWESSDPTIATVDDIGTVEGKKIGTTTITATRGSETATCTVNVIYRSLDISSNGGKYSAVNLILSEHPSEKLTAEVEDGKYEKVSNPIVTWSSSDSSIVSVDNEGKITALKPGKATITATAAGGEDTCEVNVLASPTFTDFSNAKYETTLNWNTETLQITGITPKSDSYTNYYYIITSTNEKPELAMTKSQKIDVENCKNTVEYFRVNSEENYIYTRNISKYAELNQDMYIWILEETKLEGTYYDENGNYIHYANKFVVEGKKITRAELPKLNLILQSFNIGYWNSTISNESDNYTYINFNFPSETENRKFTIKVGRITDTAILQKIQNNDYSGITELLAYAKNHDAIYSKTLTTTSVNYFRSDETLFDGNSLLEHKGYYFIYVQFDDENGKYYPIEGVTLGQAWKYTVNDSWDLWAYTSSDFNWDGLTTNYEPGSTPTTPEKENVTKPTDDTVTKDVLPNTGAKMIIVAIIFVGIASICGYSIYKKYSKI